MDYVGVEKYNRPETTTAEAPSFGQRRQLRFLFTMKTGKFGSSDNDQITIEGFRAVADITKAGGQMMGELRARIYGVKQDDMNSITTLQWKPGYLMTNTVDVTALSGDTETLVFHGNIINAWGDYQNMPNVFLRVQARSLYDGQLTAVRPFSVRGEIDAAVVMERIAGKLGLAFENNGVSVMLTDAYLANTLIEQAQELARMANFTLYFDDKTLAITPRYSARAGYVPVISPSTGMVGYPTFDGIGVNFLTLFNPSIIFGGKVKIETDLPQAAGEFFVQTIAHRLEAEKPGGPWFSYVRANRGNLVITH